MSAGMWIIAICMVSSGQCTDQVRYNYPEQWLCEVTKTRIREKLKPELVGVVTVKCREVMFVK